MSAGRSGVLLDRETHRYEVPISGGTLVFWTKRPVRCSVRGYQRARRRGLLHRMHGPAVEISKKCLAGSTERKEWWRQGQLVDDSYEAVDFLDPQISYVLDGVGA